MVFKTQINYNTHFFGTFAIVELAVLDKTSKYSILWKAITFLCGHSLLLDVVSPLCDVVSSLCDVVSPLCGVVSSFYDGVSPLRDVVLSLCVVVSPLCDVVL